jgi:response regulator of citrate/malate metabolism
MRTPEELANIVSILDGIVRPTTAETIEWALLNEERTEAHRLDQIDQDQQDMINSLSGQPRPQATAPEGFSKDLKIKTLQGMILTYQQFGASKEVLDQCHARLDELQGRKKK